MNKYIIIFTAMMAISITSFSQNKDIQIDTVFVQGNCNMCKTRIENAAYINGVKRADWDKHSHKLVVTYRPSKVSKKDIEKSIASVGHDTENMKADTSDYKKLPKCCSYREHNHAH